MQTQANQPRLRKTEINTGFLVLARNVGEDIVIGEGIVVRVMSVSCGKVKLGIKATGLHVRRAEVPPPEPIMIKPFLLAGRQEVAIQTEGGVS